MLPSNKCLLTTHCMPLTMVSSGLTIVSHRCNPSLQRGLLSRRKEKQMNGLFSAQCFMHSQNPGKSKRTWVSGRLPGNWSRWDSLQNNWIWLLLLVSRIEVLNPHSLACDWLWRQTKKTIKLKVSGDALFNLTVLRRKKNRPERPHENTNGNKINHMPRMKASNQPCQDIHLALSVSKTIRKELSLVDVT